MHRACGYEHVHGGILRVLGYERHDLGCEQVHDGTPYDRDQTGSPLGMFQGLGSTPQWSLFPVLPTYCPSSHPGAAV